MEQAQYKGAVSYTDLPTDEEASAAIIAAVTAFMAADSDGSVNEVPKPDPTAWRFAARWWGAQRGGPGRY